jgi:hypothetical protein
MTSEEYENLTIKGPHLVERDFDGAGVVAVWLTGEPATVAPKANDMHGGYGRCAGAGQVWVDDGEASNFYRGGSCPDCAPVALNDLTAASALELLIVRLSMDDSQLAFNCERAIKADLTAGRTEIARLREAVEKIADVSRMSTDEFVGQGPALVLSKLRRVFELCARAALNPETTNEG